MEHQAARNLGGLLVFLRSGKRNGVLTGEGNYSLGIDAVAKLITQTTGKVSNKVVVTETEIRAMLREKFPSIPANADMLVETDTGLSCEQLNAVTFEWTSDTNLPAGETELVPTRPRCQRECGQQAEDVKAGHDRSRLVEIAEREANE